VKEDSSPTRTPHANGEVRDAKAFGNLKLPLGSGADDWELGSPNGLREDHPLYSQGYRQGRTCFDEIQAGNRPCGSQSVAKYLAYCGGIGLSVPHLPHCVHNELQPCPPLRIECWPPSSALASMVR
jgi:hypothetical protein